MLLLNPEVFDKDFNTFPKGVSLKVKVITLMEFELVYYDVTVQHIRHYDMEVSL